MDKIEKAKEIIDENLIFHYQLRKLGIEFNCNHCQFSNEDDLCDKTHPERQPGKAEFAPLCPDYRKRG